MKKGHFDFIFQIDGTLATIARQREIFGGTNTNTAVLPTLGEAPKAPKTIHMNINVDQVRSDFCFAYSSIYVDYIPCNFSHLLLRLRIDIYQT